MNKKLRILGYACLALVAVVIVGGAIVSTMVKKPASASETSIAAKGGLVNMHESDIKPATDKVNVYIFWGKGCPHCSALGNYLAAHVKDYEKFAKIYSFEVWEDRENKEFFKSFAEHLKVDANGVPFTIFADAEPVPGFGTDKDGERLVASIKAIYDKTFGAPEKVPAADPYAAYSAAKATAGQK